MRKLSKLANFRLEGLENNKKLKVSQRKFHRKISFEIRHKVAGEHICKTLSPGVAFGSSECGSRSRQGAFNRSTVLWFYARSLPFKQTKFSMNQFFFEILLLQVLWCPLWLHEQCPLNPNYVNNLDAKLTNPKVLCRPLWMLEHSQPLPNASHQPWRFVFVRQKQRISNIHAQAFPVIEPTSNIIQAFLSFPPWPLWTSPTAASPPSPPSPPPFLPSPSSPGNGYQFILPSGDL